MEGKEWVTTLDEVDLPCKFFNEGPYKKLHHSNIAIQQERAGLIKRC
jgi:hypothetical protein